MPGPQNAIIGDDYGIDLPETKIPEEDLSRERNMARFSKTREFAALKAVIQEKQKYYQRHLPGNGLEVAQVSNEERGWAWLAADTIITEFQSILDAYEQAAEVVRDSNG